MKLIPALTIAGIIALGTVSSAALAASHQTPATPVAYVAWHEPEPTHVAVPVPSDNIAPDKSYSGYQGPSQPTCQEDEPCWDCHTMGNLICGPVAAPEAVAVAPTYVPPTVYVTGTPVVTGTVRATQAPVAKPAPVKTPAPVAVPIVKPTPVATTCPPLQHKDGVNIAPSNAPSYCVYAQ